METSKKNGSTLQINKATGAQAYHVKLMFRAMKYLIDGTLDNSFSAAHWDSFITKFAAKDKNGSCEKCGVKFKTKTGSKTHNCSIPFTNDEIGDNLAGKHGEEDVSDFIRKNLQGRAIVDVEADGGCLARAISLSVFAAESHWMLIAKAINKFMIMSWCYLMSTKTIVFPMEKVVRGKTKTFDDEKQFHTFLLSDDGLFGEKNMISKLFLTYLMQKLMCLL